jgi:hypothetical protein
MSAESHNHSSVWSTASSRARHRQGNADDVWPSHSATTEHIVYRYDPENTPSVTYHSVPHGRVGGANTLDDARKSYRSNVTRLLGVSRHELPPVVEHVEAVVAGMWVRTKVGAVHRDPVSDRMFLQTLLSAGPPQHALRDHLELATSRGATPVVVIVEPDDTLDAVLAQMRAEDVLLITHADTQNAVGWVALYGPDADGPDDARSIAAHTEIRTMPIEELTRLAHTPNGAASRAMPGFRRFALGFEATPDRQIDLSRH